MYTLPFLKFLLKPLIFWLLLRDINIKNVFNAKKNLLQLLRSRFTIQCFSVATIFVECCLLPEESRVSVWDEPCHVVEGADERSGQDQERNGG